MLSSDLISVDELNNLLINDPKLIVLDASISPVGNMEAPEHCWPNVVIPGAKFFDIEEDFSDKSSHLPHTLPNVEQFEQAAQQLGINHDSNIVVYDSFGIFSSARAWYMFKAMGHQSVAVLNGGLPKWLSQGFTTLADNPSNKAAQGNFKGRYHSSFFCDADRVAMNIGDQTTAILDARAYQRFSGQSPEPRAGIRSGHIPGAYSLPYTQCLNHELLKEGAELNQIFEHLPITPKQEWMMSCGSGITACILALAATLHGHQHISVYDGSWSEWGGDISRPVATQ